MKALKKYTITALIAMTLLLSVPKSIYADTFENCIWWYCVVVDDGGHCPQDWFDSFVHWLFDISCGG